MKEKHTSCEVVLLSVHVHLELDGLIAEITNAINSDVHSTG